MRTHNTAQLNNAELVEAYAAGPAELRTVVEDLTDGGLRARPVAGLWSTLEVVCHIADFEIVFADRLKRALAEENPTIFAGNPDEFAAGLKYEQRSIENELAVIDVIRRHITEILRQLKPADFRRTARHSEAGELTFAQLLAHVTNHIPHHIEKIREKRVLLGK